MSRPSSALASVPPANLAGGVSAIRAAGIVLAALHVVVISAHTWAHRLVDVYPGVAGKLFSVVVIILVPIVAIVLMALRRVRTGLLLFGVALVGSLIFATSQHFVIEGPDHVHAIALGPGQELFLETSVALAVVDVVGLLGVAFLLWRLARRPG